MQRREFITLLGGAAAAWPLAAGAQQDGRVRRVGILVSGAENDGSESLDAFREGLAKLGWVEGRNLRTELRFGASDIDRIRTRAAELVRLAPEVIVTNSAATTRAVQQATITIPIVFMQGGDAAANGLVRNIARPEGNTTGFSTTEPSVAGKWLEYLKEAAPQISRVAIIFFPELSPTGPSYIAAIEAAAPALSVELIKLPVRDTVDVVYAIDSFAATSSGGVIFVPVLPGGVTFTSILRLTTQHRLPTVFSARAFIAAGGLLAYSSDRIDISRRAATYVDRLLRGTKVGELPVQLPTKYNLTVNLKTAKAIGLPIPEAFLLRADELIE